MTSKYLNQMIIIDINDIPVLLTIVPVVESMCDLGVILDSRLTQLVYVAALSGRVLPALATMHACPVDNSGNCKNCNVNVNMRFIVPPLLKEHGCIT